MTVLFSPPTEPVDPGLLSRALEVGGRLANDAAEVIAATAQRGGRLDAGIGTHPYDWVTDTYRTLERHTRRVLASEFPDIPLVGGAYSGAADTPPARYRWVVDPVGGSANYVAGLPWYAFSLALLDASGPVVGVLSDPSRAEIYAAARGRGMRANGVPVRLSDQAAVPGCPVCTELTGDGGWPGLSIFLARAAHGRRGVRVLGSAALAVAQVALGHAVATVLDSYQEWDVAASLALAVEAGAVVLDRHGRPSQLPKDGMLVAAPPVVDDVLEWWRCAQQAGRNGTSAQR
ncbi:MAG: inositol monophosphatase [Pseudonocardia sp.]|nr:inositol monophosphatase [Pseudonocardia sp.]